MLRLRQQRSSPALHFPLRRLALCLDCEACFQIGDERCPACGSETWSPLAKFITAEKTMARAVESLIDETGVAMRAQTAQHVLVVARDRQSLYQMFVKELSGNPTIDVVLDRRRREPGKAEGRGRRARNVANQLHALGWAIVRKQSPGA